MQTLPSFLHTIFICALLPLLCHTLVNGKRKQKWERPEFCDTLTFSSSKSIGFFMFLFLISSYYAISSEWLTKWVKLLQHDFNVCQSTCLHCKTFSNVIKRLCHFLQQSACYSTTNRQVSGKTKCPDNKLKIKTN